jgi:hypothetical protein
MGLAAGDLDADGDQDLFMTHLRGETNTLYLNDGRGLFQDRTVPSGLGPPSVEATGFGTGLVDYDNDGRLDLLVANGAVTLLEDLVRRGDPYPMHEPNQLFHNAGGLRFRAVPPSEAGPALALSEVSRGVAFGDVDEDGDADAVVSNNAGPPRLLMNRVGQDSAWLAVSLVRRRGGSGDVRVEVRTATGARWLRSRTDGSYASAQSPRVRIGLGEHAEPVPAVRFHWPGGVEEWRDLPTERLLVAFEPPRDATP